ncbi:MAG: hypothetical protein C4346_07650 [Chloroflexota bacterium]
MKRGWVLIRWLGALVVFGALIGGVAHPAAAATATLEIHKRVCHNGAPTVDIFKECHQFPPEQEVRFRVDGGADRPVNADGNVIFAGLVAGSHTVTETEGPPLEFVRLRVWCSVLGSGVAAKEVATSGPSFTIQIAAGQHMVCDVYAIPIDLSGRGTATLELHKRICVDGPPQVDIFRECHQHPPQQPVRFQVDRGASRAVDAHGNLIFRNLAPGKHRVTETEGPPLEFVQLRVWCSVLNSGRPAKEVQTDGPSFPITLKAGEHTVCDVYAIPIDLS